MDTIPSSTIRQAAPISAIRHKQTRTRRGFTLIELMIVVAIIGILAAVALPVYQRYTVRAKISEAILALSSAKSSVTENYVAYGRMINSMTSMGIQNQQSKYVDSISWASSGNDVGVVTATLSTDATLGGAAGKTIDMTGTANGQSITWVCGPGHSNGVDALYLPASCQN